MEALSAFGEEIARMFRDLARRRDGCYLCNGPHDWTMSLPGGYPVRLCFQDGARLGFLAPREPLIASARFTAETWRARMYGGACSREAELAAAVMEAERLTGSDTAR